VLLLVKAPRPDVVEHENDASVHLLIVLDYLIKQHTERAKTSGKQQVGGVLIVLSQLV